MKKIFLFFLSVAVLQCAGYSQPVKTNYVSSFSNSNHPQVAYWFFAPNMMSQAAYRGKVDSFAKYSKYTLIFLTARGCNFYDAGTMHPVLKDLVTYAHSKGLKIGLQIFKNDDNTRLENTDRLMQEGELTLDESGQGSYHVKAKGSRNMNIILKSELFRIYAFKKTSEGFYNASSLKDITALATSTSDTGNVSLSIHAGAAFSGYTAYILTQHYYKSCSNFSEQAKSTITNAFKAYADIPFDGIGLDEYKNMTIVRSMVLKDAGDVFRERLYSLGMADKLKKATGMDPGRTLFDMRYAPEGKPAVRIRAINEYMNLLRTSTLSIESAMYDLGKQLYGKNTFIGLHSTFHNNLDGDEVWQTGISWWNIKRDYGHTDEETATPIQMGIGMCYPMNAMYNMYYNKSLERIWTKALYDLRYGIRTHYHAANDVQGWGVSIDEPQALEKINKVENAARLLNRFNPPFPQMKLLVVYGMESLCNWYPDTASRGLYDVNESLDMDKKSMELWNNGYLNAAVPTDVIEDGRLKLDAAGKPVLNGHVFDAIIFMGPQYSKAVTLNFLNNYVNKGGRLLIDGNARYDFYGNTLGDKWKNIVSRAIATSYSLDNVSKLGINKNPLTDGVANGNGIYTFTSIESLETGAPATFSFTYNGNSFSGQYKGLAAIKVDAGGNLQQLAATRFLNLQRNGKEILHLSREADVFISDQKGVMNTTIADETGSTKIFFDK